MTMLKGATSYMHTSTILHTNTMYLCLKYIGPSLETIWMHMDGEQPLTVLLYNGLIYNLVRRQDTFTTPSVLQD